ncbi:MAG: hypothetical protein VX181_07410, partial [Pseudomonadota bacterium]|nr:hypothetical protein [Pseudomonadota bacterium]
MAQTADADFKTRLQSWLPKLVLSPSLAMVLVFWSKDQPRSIRLISGFHPDYNVKHHSEEYPSPRPYPSRLTTSF